MSFLASIVILTNLGFTVGFDTQRGQPAWASYDLEPQEIVVTNRASYAFRADPRVGPDMKAAYKELSDRYDRGHLVPAADLNWSRQALRESYYFSNVCPMLKALNRGAWAKNEKEVRALASSGTVHVVTFPIYGTNNIPVAFVKVAYGWFGIRYYRETNEDSISAR